MIATLNPQVTSSARAAAAGLLIMAMSYALSNVSGAHFNPMVTLAFALRRVFPWKYVPAYWLAQLGGAVLGAGFLCLLLGPIGHIGATLPEHGDAKAFAMEAFLTFLLVSVILSVATRHKVVGPTAALASGGTVALCGLFARPISGASMNPVRSLGPFIVGGSFARAWVYLAGPSLGAVLGSLCVAIVHPHKHAEEQEAAAGDRYKLTSPPSAET
jgi:MIP family channel proteins